MYSSRSRSRLALTHLVISNNNAASSHVLEIFGEPQLHNKLHSAYLQRCRFFFAEGYAGRRATYAR